MSTRPTKERLEEIRKDIEKFGCDVKSAAELLAEIDALEKERSEFEELAYKNASRIAELFTETRQLREALDCARKGLNEYRPRTTVIQEIDSVLRPNIGLDKADDPIRYK